MFLQFLHFPFTLISVNQISETHKTFFSQMPENSQGIHRTTETLGKKSFFSVCCILRLLQKLPPHDAGIYVNEEHYLSGRRTRIYIFCPVTVCYTL